MKSGSAKKRASVGAKRSPAKGSTPQGKKRQGGDDDGDSDPTTPSYNLRQRDPSKKRRYTDQEWDIDQAPVEEEVEVRSTTPEEVEPEQRDSPWRPGSRTSPKAKEPQVQNTNAALLPKQLKDSLKRLKNLLKLPKARRWAFCEYFVSDFDRALLKGDEEFRLCLRETFPDLRTSELRRAEWRQIRRLIGKPRRYSQAFLDYERSDLEKKRKRIRDIQKGAALTVDDEVDIPFRIPQPLVVGARVVARVRFPKDGIFSGTVDAVMDGRYRIIFDKDVVMPLIVFDHEIMSENPDDLVPVSFFLEKNKAAQPPTFRNANFLLACEKLLASDEISSLIKDQGSVVGAASLPATAMGGTPSIGATAGSSATSREERCGSYPLRMIVMVIKLSKLLDKKKGILSSLRELNSEAEIQQMRSDYFTMEFQEKYAHTIIELEEVNKLVEAYLIGVSEYVGTLLPQLTEVTVTSRPEALLKFCQMHASRVVKTTNITTTSVKNTKSVELVTSLTALMLQIRALGRQQCNAYELNSLWESIEEIKLRLADDTNRSVFEDDVEVNVKHMELAMRGWRGFEPVSADSAAAE